MRLVTVTVRCDWCDSEMKEDEAIALRLESSEWKIPHEMDLCAVCFPDLVGKTREVIATSPTSTRRATSPHRRNALIKVAMPPSGDPNSWDCYECSRNFHSKGGLAVHLTRSGHDAHEENRQAYFG